MSLELGRTEQDEAFFRRAKGAKISPDDAECVLKHAGAAGLKPNPAFFTSRQVFNEWVRAILSKAESAATEGETDSVAAVLRKARQSLGFFPQDRHDPVGSTRELPVNQDLVVGVLEKPGAGLTFARVVECDEANFIIENLQRGDMPATMGSGMTVRVKFSFMDTGYQFDTRILGQVDHSTGPAWKLKHTDFVKKLYQRKFARIQLNHEVEFRIIPLEKSSEFVTTGLHDPDFLVEINQGVLRDLSEGGFALLSPVDVSNRDFVFLEFDIREKEHQFTIPLLGQVVNHASRDGETYLISAQIPKAVPEAYRAPLARFIESKLHSDSPASA